MKNSRKFVIVLQAGAETHEGMARALHAFLYTSELKQKGYAVKLIFDGAGTEWLAKVNEEGSELKAIYKEVEDSVVGFCEFCSTAFNVRDKMPSGISSVGEYRGHPSLTDYIDKGYEIIVL